MFLGTIVPRKYMPIISSVGLFCFDKFEDNQNEKVLNIFPNVILNYVYLTLDIDPKPPKFQLAPNNILFVTKFGTYF